VIEKLEQAKGNIVLAYAEWDNFGHRTVQDIIIEADGLIDEAIAKLKTLFPEPAEKGYWWCPNCKEEVSSTTVTYQELHDTCGHPAEWIEPVPRYKSKPCFYTPERWQAETGEPWPDKNGVYWRYEGDVKEGDTRWYISQYHHNYTRKICWCW
jgi:hypothetical protein